jgi:hypothetical protein
MMKVRSRIRAALPMISWFSGFGWLFKSVFYKPPYGLGAIRNIVLLPAPSV